MTVIPQKSVYTLFCVPQSDNLTQLSIRGISGHFYFSQQLELIIKQQSRIRGQFKNRFLMTI